MKKIKDIIKGVYNKVDDTWSKFINLKFVNFIFKFLPHNLFLFILFVISIFSIVSFYNANKYKYYYSQDIIDETVGPIYDIPYDISFEDVELIDDPEQLCVKFAKYGYDITSDFRYVLYKGNEKVTDEIFNARSITDGVNYCFDIPTVTKDNVKEYHAVISSINATDRNTITIYKSKKSDLPAISFIYKEKLISIRSLIALIFIILFLLVNYLINNKKIKIEHFWLLISLIYILFITISIPAYEVPDEHIHYVNSINLSQIDFSKNLYEQFSEREMVVPDDYGCIAYSAPQKYDKVNEFSDVTECLQSRNNILKGDGHINASTKTGYIFAAIGYKMADIFSNSPLILFYAGRIFNAIVSILLIFFAIKIAPKYKMILLSIASIPMFLQQMISYSYDSLLNSVCIFVIAIIINLVYNKESKVIPWGIALILCGVFITEIKQIYLFLFFCLLFIPKDKFGKNYLKILYCLIIVLASYYIGMGIRNIITYDPSSVSEARSLINTEKFNYQNLKEHPMMVFSIAFYTFLYQGVFYLRGFFGYFGWFRYRLSDILVFAYCLYMLYLCFSTTKIKSKRITRILVLLGLLFSVAAIFGAMYLKWTSPGMGYVEGVQGRYFLPLIIPLMILFTPKKEWFKENESINYSFINIMLLQFVLIILFGYY